MSEDIVIRCCAPTLAAIKTGSLFNCTFASRVEMTESLRAVNRCLTPKGVCALPLKFQAGRALIFLYRPRMLEEDLKDTVAAQILKVCGYPEGKPTAQINYLIRRLRECEAFPHEIGLFLGYPAVDVRGFMEHRECKCTGLWKVFDSDEEQARRMFERCRHCTRIYTRLNNEGWSLSRLTIQSGQFSYKMGHEERKVTA